ncbi:MAG: flavodoxin family protein [Thermoproteota archaeon]|nr:flavodoxin family protein [Candidatus Brockarchaeota archaeon]
MTKVLFLNGSPRNYGLTYTLLSFALRGASSVGAETKLFNLYELEIHPCLGCLSDNQSSCMYPCVIDDDMKKIYHEVLSSNGIVIATPIYWFAPSGVVKNFIDRLTVFENMIFINGRSLVEGKIAGVIAVGNDGGAVQAISSIISALISMGFSVPPFSFCYHTSNEEPNDNTLLDAFNVGRNVALLAKVLERNEIKWYDTKRIEEISFIKEEVKTICKLNKEINLLKRNTIINKLILNGNAISPLEEVKNKNVRS